MIFERATAYSLYTSYSIYLRMVIYNRGVMPSLESPNASCGLVRHRSKWYWRSDRRLCCFDGLGECELPSLVGVAVRLKVAIR